jgi:hypothetical protein
VGAATLEPYWRRPVEGGLSHVVFVLPAGNAPSEIDRLPPGIQTTNWTMASDTAGILALVRDQLKRSKVTLAERYTESGEPADRARARLLGFSENPRPQSLATIPKFPTPFPQSKGDRFVGRANDLWRIDFALGTLRGGTGAAALTGSIEGTGGIGKTQLAIEYVHRFGRRFPGGIFWIDAEDDLQAQFHGILRELDPKVPDLLTFRKEQRDAYRELAAAW